MLVQEEAAHTRSIRMTFKNTPATFKARPENPNAQKKENLLKQYNSNKEYANDRNSILDTEITKHFPGHGSFKGKITEYHPASDNYSINYQDGDSEIMSHSNILKYIKGTQQYEDHHENKKALYSAFNTAVSTTIAPSDNVPENYKDARATPDVADWMKPATLKWANYDPSDAGRSYHDQPCLPMHQS